MNVVPGNRIELTRHTDPYSPLKAGDRGTVAMIDSLGGTIHVNWDNGSTLGLVPAAGDDFMIVDEQ